MRTRALSLKTVRPLEYRLCDALCLLKNYSLFPFIRGRKEYCVSFIANASCTVQ